MAQFMPRDVARFKDQLMTAVSIDKETADMCFYSKPQDGGSVVGPSVRLAELAISAYGNLFVGSRPGRVDRHEMTVTGVGYAMDLQNNNMVTAEVVRPIRKRNGTIYSDAMIATTLMAASSIARRNAVFQVIPRVYVDRACTRAQEVASGGDMTMEQRRANCLEALEKKGAHRDLVLLSLKVPSAENLTLAQIVDLRGRYNALKDGTATVEELFPIPEKDRAEDLPPGPPIEPEII